MPLLTNAAAFREASNGPSVPGEFPLGCPGLPPDPHAQARAAIPVRASVGALRARPARGDGPAVPDGAQLGVGFSF